MSAKRIRRGIPVPSRLIPEYKPTRQRLLFEFERKYVVRVLKKAKLNVSEAAKIAGIDRKHLWRIMRRCGVSIK